VKILVKASPCQYRLGSFVFTLRISRYPMTLLSNSIQTAKGKQPRSTCGIMKVAKKIIVVSIQYILSTIGIFLTQKRLIEQKSLNDGTSERHHGKS
jgi:hypothetical protein